MPKDPKKNVDRYKIRGGDINEFEFDKNQAAFYEQKHHAGANLIPGTPPEEKPQALRPVVANKAAKKTAKKAIKKTTKKAAKKGTTKASTKKAAVSMRGASAKKLAARKAATNARKGAKKK